jgi:hypothetical protein
MVARRYRPRSRIRNYCIWKGERIVNEPLRWKPKSHIVWARGVPRNTCTESGALGRSDSNYHVRVLQMVAYRRAGSAPMRFAYDYC